MAAVQGRAQPNGWGPGLLVQVAATGPYGGGLGRMTVPAPGRDRRTSNLAHKALCGRLGREAEAAVGMTADGPPVHVRVHDAPSRVTIDVSALGKASGMAAYRIAEFTP